MKTFTENSGKEKNTKSVQVLVHSGHAKNKYLLEQNVHGWIKQVSFSLVRKECEDLSKGLGSQGQDL